MHFRTCLLLVALLCRPLPAADVNQSFGVAVRPFLKTYCYQCHGADEQFGERRFDELTGAISDNNSLLELQDILDQLNLGEMPPSDAERQPTDEARGQVIQWLTQAIADYHSSHQPAAEQAILRRLNAREYRNAVRDLLHLDMTMFDPTVEFPRDQTSEHLDTIGSALVTSGHLLAKYLSAAELVVNKALYPLEKPNVQTWTFEENFKQQPEIDQVHGKTNNFEHLTLYDVVGADKHEGAYAHIYDFGQGVPYDGFYDISFKAEALNREHPFDDDYLGTDRSEPLRLGIVAGRRDAGPLHKPQPIEPLLTELELADGSGEYTVRVWLDEGFTPRFTFRNGLFDARNLWNRTLKAYPDQFPEPRRSGIVEARYLAIKHGKFPQIHVDDIEIKGPYFDAWPTAGQKALLGEDAAEILAAGELTAEQLDEQLREFATRAFRRPVSDDEVERLVRFAKTRREVGRSSLEAFADTIKSILCSPSFLFTDAPVTETGSPQPTNSFALATRLSLFLWSSLPDDELLQISRETKLAQAEERRAQVRRMLSDAKSEAFVRDFLDSWLTLRDLGASPPDRGDFAEYYHYDLGTAMRQETQLFFRELLDQNLSIHNFIDSDFTFVNRPLARHYGIDPPEGFEFQRVPLGDKRRGGLLGQAAVLTVTANGIDTSPVVRGVWLLENILGTPPSPPPPDVEPLDPDVRGATTIRDQLEKHRTISSCNNCHRKIDPLGFALENFDAIGSWRGNYEKDLPVDASGELPNGKAFQDVVGLKEILLEQDDLFARALTEKLFAYALGRHLRPTDRPHVDRVLEKLEESGDGLRDLVEHIVMSPLFAEG